MLTSLGAALLVLLIVNVIALACERVVSRRLMVASRIEHADILGHMAGITGVINAVLFAFIVFVAWTYYDRARDAVNQEVGLVWQLWHDVESAEPGHPMDKVLPKALQQRAAHGMIWYVNYVLTAEWPAMKHPGHGRLDAIKAVADDSLRTIYEDVLWENGQQSSATDSTAAATRHGPRVGPGQRALIGEMISRFNTLFDVRRRRIDYSVEGAIPPTVWIALLGGGLLCIACCWLVGFRDFRLHAFVTALIASSFGLIVFLILALDTPFKGIAPISKAPFEVLRDDIRNWEAKEHGDQL